MIPGFEGTILERKLARELFESSQEMALEHVSLTLAAMMALLCLKGLITPEEMTEMVSILKDA